MFQAADLVTISLLVALEGLLSADNAMVLAVLVLGLPKHDQRKALRYGIIGAFAFRAIATLAAAYLIQLEPPTSSICRRITLRAAAAPKYGAHLHRPARCSGSARSGRPSPRSN